MKPLIRAKTPAQKEFIRNIVENDITICNGISGTGKTYVACGIGLEYVFREDQPQKCVVATRPIVSIDDKLGFLKGDLEQKIQPYYRPIFNSMAKLLGGAKEVLKLQENEVIKFEPVELCRGMDYENSFIIVDECQNLSHSEIVAIITRLGVNSKIVFCGDADQSDIGHNNGMTFLIDKLSHRDYVGYSELGEKDIQRNPIIARILKDLNWRREI